MKSENRRLLMFGTFTVLFLVVLSTLYFNTKNSNILTLLMISPAFSVLITRLLTREGSENLFIRPNFKGNIKWYLSAYILTPVVAYSGAILFFLIYPSKLDMLNSSFAISENIKTISEYVRNLIYIVPLAILVNPILGIVQCFGEEFAWRAYLFPKLCSKYSVSTSVLITGIIWGVWHSPIIAMGYNYGSNHPVRGIIAMIILCIVLGVIETYLFIKTNSVWAPVLFHASINGIDLWSPSTLFMSTKNNPFLGPDLTGILGGIGLFVVAVFCMIDIYKNQTLSISENRN